MLAYLDQAFVNFRDFFGPSPGHGCRWVDLKRFQLLAAGSDERFLRALAGHEQFRDDYAGGGVDPSGVRHGPYWLESLGLDAYEPVDETVAMDVLRSWAGQYRDLPERLSEVLERDVYTPVRAATGRPATTSASAVASAVRSCGRTRRTGRRPGSPSGRMAWAFEMSAWFARATPGFTVERRQARR
ncbi:hypothetical protein [Actinomadura sp. DC4]|uniref:hypothetical protein n=1 Tax=Actinomadura sp. DC4 TaxID=3055069 RepID=UPI0025B11334|nr:hypothetical protein [Actinomadura sp. DC4]MDN3351979.1 hypothetical protein [Actinomadura sp. DC4]